MSVDRATFTDTLLLACVATLGWKEEPSGSNWSPAIKSWLAKVGIEQPAPWCCAWTHAMYEAASEQYDMRNPHPHTASSRRLWDLTPDWQRRETPIRGAVVVFAHVGDDGQHDGKGHVGIVAEILPSRSCRTIEGNTNAEGSRNGDQVAEHTWDWGSGKRGRLELVGFADFLAERQT